MSHETDLRDEQEATDRMLQNQQIEIDLSQVEYRFQGRETLEGSVEDMLSNLSESDGSQQGSEPGQTDAQNA